MIFLLAGSSATSRDLRDVDDAHISNRQINMDISTPGDAPATTGIIPTPGDTPAIKAPTVPSDAATAPAEPATPSAPTEPKAPATAGYACDSTVNWIKNQTYTQISLTDPCKGKEGSKICNANPRYGGENNKDNAIDFCKQECDERSEAHKNHANSHRDCTGFFFSTDILGHEICGFYSTALGKASPEMHSSGAVCDRHHLRIPHAEPAAVTPTTPSFTSPTTPTVQSAPTKAFNCPEFSFVQSARWPIADITDCRCLWGYHKEHIAHNDASVTRTMRNMEKKSYSCVKNPTPAPVSPKVPATPTTATPASTSDSPATDGTSTGIDKGGEEGSWMCPQRSFVSAQHWPLEGFHDCTCEWGYIKDSATEECVDPKAWLKSLWDPTGVVAKAHKDHAGPSKDNTDTTSADDAEVATPTETQTFEIHGDKPMTCGQFLATIPVMIQTVKEQSNAQAVVVESSSCAAPSSSADATQSDSERKRSLRFRQLTAASQAQSVTLTAYATAGDTVVAGEVEAAMKSKGVDATTSVTANTLEANLSSSNAADAADRKKAKNDDEAAFLLMVIGASVGAAVLVVGLAAFMVHRRRVASSLLANLDSDSSSSTADVVRASVETPKESSKANAARAAEMV